MSHPKRNTLPTINGKCARKNGAKNLRKTSQRKWGIEMKERWVGYKGVALGRIDWALLVFTSH